MVEDHGLLVRVVVLQGSQGSRQVLLGTGQLAAEICSMVEPGDEPFLKGRRVLGNGQSERIGRAEGEAPVRSQQALLEMTQKQPESTPEGGRGWHVEAESDDLFMEAGHVVELSAEGGVAGVETRSSHA